MLLSLHIENIAVISTLDIDFAEGFNVMTGETGAGKSIVIDSINLILGARAERDIIRTGEGRAFVSALFDGCTDGVRALCVRYDIPCDDGLMVSREISADGRSVAKINGRAVPLSAVREIAGELITVHGQHDNGRLLRSETHIDFLDLYAEDAEALSDYREKYEYYRETKKALDKLSTDSAAAERELEFTEYQIKEIDAAHLKSGEEENLREMKKKIKSLEKINKLSDTVYSSLYENDKGVGACTLIDRAAAALSGLYEYLDGAEELSEKLTECKQILTDIAFRADGARVELNGDPDTILTKIESRLALIDKIERKYGATVEDVLAYRVSLDEKLSTLKNSDENREELEKKLYEAEKSARASAKVLSDIRRAAAARLEKGVTEELSYLDMGKAHFFVSVRESEALDASGADSVEFLIAANTGERALPLAKTASGGELSRVMLAIKCTLRGMGHEGTMIFDEVDTGVSGKTSAKIGKKLRELSHGGQVLCVTHSAQIAALADRHFRISKAERDGRMYCSVSELDYDGRVAELSRIMGTESISESVGAAAREMIDAARTEETH